MSRQKPYSDYKKSGVEWLGMVPAHWVVKPVYSVGSLRNGYPFKADRFMRAGLSANRVVRIRDILGDDDAVYSDEECPEWARLESGDIIVGMDGDFNAHLWVRGTSKLNQRMCAVRGETLDVTQFLSHCLALPLKVINDLTYSTTVKHLSSYDLLHAKLCLPQECEELRKINQIIAGETARIGSLITKKLRLIELLKEKRRALITHIVTKGLNPTAKMKDSGVEWIGEVPENWSSVPIRRVATLESGHTPSRSVPEYWTNCTIPWFTLADIWQVRQEGRVVVTETAERVSEIGIANSSARKLPAGTVILSRTASVGFPAIMGCEMATSQDFAAWVCGERIDSRFLYLSLVAMRNELGRLMMGSTHKTIYMPDIEQLRCPLPPIPDQKRIAEFANRETGRIDALIMKTQRSIDLLKERRSAFVTAAVTGRIDLREAA